MGIQFNLQFSAQYEFFEESILANISGDHLLDLALLEQQANAEVIHSCIVTNDGQILRSLVSQSSDEVLRNSAQSKPTHHNGGTIANIRDGFVCVGDELVHRSSSSHGMS